ARDRAWRGRHPAELYADAGPSPSGIDPISSTEHGWCAGPIGSGTREWQSRRRTDHSLRPGGGMRDGHAQRESVSWGPAMRRWHLTALTPSSDKVHTREPGSDAPRAATVGR